MARPRKPEFDLRSELVRFTVRPSEYLRIQQAAAASGRTVSDYVRSVILERRVNVVQTRMLEHAAYDQLRRIGVNLNQAVRKYHSTGHPPPELESAAATVERFLLEVLGDGPEGGG